MRTKQIGLAIAVLHGVMVLAISSQTNAENAQRKRLLKDYHAMEGEIVFYGKVVDQYGNSVEGASVEVSVPTVKKSGAMWYAKKTLLTDKKGGFEVSGKTYGVSKLVGQYLYVKRITKDGYAGDWVRGTNRTFSFSTSNAKRFVPDVSKPVVYVLRKKGKVSFLFEEVDLRFHVRVTESGKAIGYDFIRRRRIRDVEDPSDEDAALVCDIQVKATFDTKAATWAVVLSPGTDNGGIIISDQLLYEAPEIGYKPEYTFTPEDRKPVKAKYVYLKSRKPAIYTRLVIKGINANKTFFRLICESVTNPYGDRNLEQATDLPYAVTRQLTDEARAAFRKNKRPSKPDLAKLVREEK